MDLMYLWYSGSDWGFERQDWPQTEKEKVKFAEDIIAAVRGGWDITVYVERSNDEDDE